MKKWILTAFAIAGLLVTSCQEGASSKVKKKNVEAAVSESADNVDAPVMQFDKTIHDFGTINEGDKVQTTFSFTKDSIFESFNFWHDRNNGNSRTNKMKDGEILGEASGCLLYTSPSPRDS